MSSKRSGRWWLVLEALACLRPHRNRVLLGLVCVAITNVFRLAGPWVIGKYAVDSFAISVTPGKLAWYGATVILLTAFEGIFRFGMRWILIGVSRDVEFTLRGDVFRHLETLPLSFYQKNKTGDLMSRATNDLNNVRMMMGPGIMYSVDTLMTAVFSIALMCSLSWRLTLAALIPLPLVSWGVSRLGQRIHALSEESQEQLAALSARVQESMAGMRVVKAFVQERHEIRDFERLNQELVNKNNALIRVTSVFFPTMQFVIGVSIVIVLWFGGRQVVQGQISLGDFVAFTVYLGMLSWPMIALGWVINLVERGRASWERLNHILREQPDITDCAGVIPDLEIRGEIEFRNLTFSYGASSVLTDVSLRIPAGKTMAVVGATGSGKSSLVQLIPRLYNAPENTLFIDGVPIERIPLEKLRRSIGFVPQETFLFGETIRENIAFGVPAASMDQVIRAAQISNLAGDVQLFPQGYETIVGERGITLSGGQKQRTAISRAVIRDPRILILDDALSSVDTYTEEQILKELQGVMAGRTSILISHRVSTVRDADEIIVLDGGHIVERGSHDELVRQAGYYAELHRKQLLEEELAAN